MKKRILAFLLAMGITISYMPESLLALAENTIKTGRKLTIIQENPGFTLPEDAVILNGDNFSVYEGENTEFILLPNGREVSYSVSNNTIFINNEEEKIVIDIPYGAQITSLNNQIRVSVDGVLYAVIPLEGKDKYCLSYEIEPTATPVVTATQTLEPTATPVPTEAAIATPTLAPIYASEYIDTLEEFDTLVEKRFAELRSFDDFSFYPESDEEALLRVRAEIFVNNRNYITQDLVNLLAASGRILFENFATDYALPSNIGYATDIQNQINDYNQHKFYGLNCYSKEDGKKITQEYVTNDLALITLSGSLFNPHDIEVATEAERNLEVLANALNTNDRELIQESFRVNHDLLTSLNADTGNLQNSSSMSSCANAAAYLHFNSTVSRALEGYLDENYSRKELSSYYDSASLNQDQWYMIGEIEFLTGATTEVPAIEYDDSTEDKRFLSEMAQMDGELHYPWNFQAYQILRSELGDTINNEHTR